MNRALQIAHLSLLIAATALIGVVAWQGLAIAHRVDSTLATANQTLTRINGKNGTIAMLDEDLGTLKSAVIHADLIARHEQQQLTTLDGQEREIFADIHLTMGATRDTLTSLQETAHSATDAIHTANESIARLQPLEQAATQSIAHLDVVIADPSIPATLSNTAKITSDAARITKDAADEADKFTHPPKRKIGFWATTDAVMIYIHSHIMPPIF